MVDNAQMVYGDVEVRNDKHGFISLTDMWFAAGKPEGKYDPRKWKNSAGAEFIDFIAKKLNVLPGDIFKATRGKFGGTWAYWQIALAYAKYLSPEFHAWANQVIKERIEEDANPELGITRSRERAIATWRKRGKDDVFITARINGIDARNAFTATLDDHGVAGKGYAICTNNIYTPIFGGGASEIRKQKGLPEKSNIRDNMSVVELGGVMFAEILASDRISRENRQGLNPCASACLSSGMQVKATIEKHEQDMKPLARAESEPIRNSRLANRLDNIKKGKGNI